MTSFEVYQKYVALKTHFNSHTYDYIKNGGRTKAKHETFLKRPDRLLFVSLAAKNWDYVIPFMIANFVANENLWIGDLVLNSESEITYFEWKKKFARMFSDAEIELKSVRDFMSTHNLHFNDLFKIDDEKLPIIFRLMVQRYISMETYMIIDHVLNFSQSFESLLDNPLYKKWEHKLRKYGRFITLDDERCKSIVSNAFLE